MVLDRIYWTFRKVLKARGAVQSAETYILQMALVMQKQFGYKKKSRTKCKI